MTTISDMLNGGDMKALRGVVCGATGIITWTKNQKQTRMIKISLRDKSSFITVLVFNDKFFDLLTKAAELRHVVKLEGYRRSETPNTLMLGGGAACSALTTRQCSLTPAEIEEARVGMYARLQPISVAKLSPSKTRVSVKGKITKIVSSTDTAKRILLTDLADKSDSMVTIWQPNHRIQAEVGQSMTLYDARASDFEGGSIDTSAATCIELSGMAGEKTHANGQVVGFGYKRDTEIVEVILEGQDDEESFTATADAMTKLKSMGVTANVKLTLQETFICDVEVSDTNQVDSEEDLLRL